MNKLKYPVIVADCDKIQIYNRIPTTKNKKIMNFSAGAGHWIYFLGVTKFIQEEKYDITNTDFVGTSAGAFASAVCAYNTPHDIIFEQALLHLERCRNNWFGCFGYWNTSYRKAVLDSCDQLQTVKPITNIFIGVSKLTLHGFQKQYFDGGLTPNEFATALQTSCWIPFVTAPIFQPLFCVCNALYCDGFWTGKDDAPHAKQLVISPNKLEWLPLYTYWLWLGNDYNTMLYKLGYEHAKKHRKLFDEFFM